MGQREVLTVHEFSVLSWKIMGLLESKNAMVFSVEMLSSIFPNASISCLPQQSLVSFSG